MDPGRQLHRLRFALHRRGSRPPPRNPGDLGADPHRLRRRGHGHRRPLLRRPGSRLSGGRARGAADHHDLARHPPPGRFRHRLCGARRRVLRLHASLLVLGDRGWRYGALLRLRHERFVPRQPASTLARPRRRVDLDLDHPGPAPRAGEARMRFRAKVLLAGKTATGVEVPAKVVEGLGSTKRPLVKVTINAYTYRSAIAPMGGTFMLGISDEVRKAAHVAAGDTVDVNVELDTEKRDVEVPPELAKAMAKDPKVKNYFESLSYSGKIRLTAPIANGKTAETRARNLDKAMRELKAKA